MNSQPMIGRGKRHKTAHRRWEVISSSDGLLRGRFLSESNGYQMLAYGDYYPDGTVILIHPDEVKVEVRGTQLFLIDAEPD